MRIKEAQKTGRTSSLHITHTHTAASQSRRGRDLAAPDYYYYSVALSEQIVSSSVMAPVFSILMLTAEPGLSLVGFDSPKPSNTAGSQQIPL